MWWKSVVNLSFFLSVATLRMRSSACDALAPLCVRCVLCWSAFPLVPALRSTGSAAFGSAADRSAAGCPALFVGFIAVGSEEAPIEGLASVRHSNGTCSFPAFRFHEWLCEVRREGISETRLTYLAHQRVGLLLLTCDPRLNAPTASAAPKSR